MRRFLAFMGTMVLAACGGASTTGPGNVITVATVAVSPVTGSVLAQQTVQLSATPRDSNGNAVTGKTITWTASPAGLVTVSANGLVTGVAPGMATVNATTDGKFGTATITVNDGAVVSSAGGTVTAAGGKVLLDIPAGALSGTTEITVTPAVNPPLASLLVPGATFDLGPSGTQFAQPVTLSFTYDPSRLPPGADESLIGLYVLSGTTWHQVSGNHVDVGTHTVTATTMHFTPYTACPFPCGPDSPDIRISLDRSTLYKLRPGGTVQVPFQVSRNNFTGGITFSLANAPAGMTMSASLGGFSHDFATGTLTFNAAASTPPGSYRVQVHGSGSGIQDQYDDTQLQVTSLGLAFNPGGISILQGGQGTSTVTITRSGVTGSISLSATGLPAGVTASFSPTPVSGTSSVVTFAATSAASPGNSTVTINAVASDGTTGSATFPMAVVLAGSFSIAGTPAFANLTPGGSGSTGVQATRGPGFTGPIAYAVTGLPAGLTANVTTTSVADSLKITFAATAAVPLGNYNVTVTGTNGTNVQNATIVVTVSSPGTTTVHLDYSACVTAGRSTWLAYQDGSGTLTMVPGMNGIYTFPITSGRGTVAVVIAGPSGHRTTVLSGTAAELGLLPSCSNSYLEYSLLYPTATDDFSKSVTVSATGLGPDDIGQLTLGQPPSVGLSVGNPSSTLTQVPAGSVDLIGWRYHNVTPGTNIRGAILRAVNVPQSGTASPVDFNGAESFAPVSASYTVSGPGAETAHALMVYSTGTACTNFAFLGLTAPATPGTIYGFPGSVQQASDLHQLEITTTGRIAINLFHTMANQTVTLGSPLSTAPTITTLSGPYRRLQVDATVPADYPFMTYSYGDGTNIVRLVGTAGYFGSQTMTLSMPDLSGLAGLLTSWFPAAGSHGNFTYAAGTTLVTPCADGGAIRGARLFGSN